MTQDELKGLRLRRTQLMAELDRVNGLLSDLDAGLSPAESITLRQTTKGWVPRSAVDTPREEFYKQAERDSIQ